MTRLDFLGPSSAISNNEKQTATHAMTMKSIGCPDRTAAIAYHPSPPICKLFQVLVVGTRSVRWQSRDRTIETCERCLQAHDNGNPMGTLGDCDRCSASDARHSRHALRCGKDFNITSGFRQAVRVRATCDTSPVKLIGDHSRSHMLGCSQRLGNLFHSTEYDLDLAIILTLPFREPHVEQSHAVREGKISMNWSVDICVIRLPVPVFRLIASPLFLCSQLRGWSASIGTDGYGMAQRSPTFRLRPHPGCLLHGIPT
jgi:hypothetical protein